MGRVSDVRWSAVRDRQVPDGVESLLRTVPEWFGQPESNAEYVEDSRTMETWTVRNEVGVGTAMIEAIDDEARQKEVKLLQVKTLGPSRHDLSCARTRHFYENMGFLPLEEANLWGEATPCLIMVKALT